METGNPNVYQQFGEWPHSTLQLRVEEFEEICSFSAKILGCVTNYQILQTVGEPSTKVAILDKHTAIILIAGLVE